MTLRSVLLVTAAIALLSSTPAIAASGGGGGGGAAPSVSGPTIDPVKRYQDGVTALQASKWTEAQQAFGDVLRVADRDPNSNYMMGLAYVGEDKFKESRKYFENAVKFSKGDHAPARGWLGKVYAKAGDAKKANEQKTALAAMKDKCAGTCKSATSIDMAIKQIDDAIANPSASLSPAAGLLKLASADGDAAYLVASGLINEGRYEDALGSLREAALVFGPHPDILTYEGFANRKLGNYDTAIGFYSAALKLQPNHRGANEYLGEYYVEIGDMTKAKLQLAKLDTICKFGCEEAEELRRWIDGHKS
ncbi:MAG: tetratricopeptide repeat protein [Alphaproteobacteria bacterium]